MIIIYFQVLQFKQAMEGIQLRQDSLRRTNTVGAFRNISNSSRSLISTALGTDSYIRQDLRKSRIQNLPNYKKNQLGDNINFIVVFQTIEIERLSNEVQLLRVKVKQNQRQLFNAQNYEVQIRQLTQKCFNHQKQKQLYKEQIQKMNSIAQNLYNENQTLKQHLEEMNFGYGKKIESEQHRNKELLLQNEKCKEKLSIRQRNQEKQMSQLKKAMQNQKRSAVDREIHQLSKRHNHEKSNLENQINKYKDLMLSKTKQNDDLRRKSKELQQFCNRRYEQENALEQANKNRQFLQKQLSKALSMMKSKERQADQIKRNLQDELQKEKKASVMLKESSTLKETINELMLQLQKSRQRCNQYEQQMLNHKEMKFIINQLQEKLQVSTFEINRLNALLKGKNEQGQKSKNRCNLLQEELNRYQNLRDQMAHSESKYNLIVIENERINSMLKARLQEIENWKKKHSSVQGIVTRYALLQKDRKNLQDKYNNQLKQGEELKFQLKRLSDSLLELNNLQKVNADQNHQNYLLIKEIDRLNMLLKNNVQDLGQSSNKYMKLQESLKDYKDRAQHLNNSQSRLKLFQQENARLHKVIQDKNHEIKELQQQKIQMLAKSSHSKSIESKIPELQEQIHMKNHRMGELSKEKQLSDNKVKALTNQIKDIVQGNRRLNESNMGNESKAQEMKNKIMRLQGQNKKKGQLQLVCQDLHRQVITYLGELQSTQKKYKEYEDAYKQQKDKNGQLSRNMNLLNQQRQKLLRQLNKNMSRTQDLGPLQQKIKSHFKNVHQKDKQIEKLLEKMTTLERECGKLMGQFNKLVVIVQNNEKETEHLRNKIQEYQDYARRISILASQMDRLVAINKHLQEDNKIMRLKYADNIQFQLKQQRIALTQVLMAIEIQSLRSRLQKREMNYDEMRKSILQPIRKI